MDPNPSKHIYVAHFLVLIYLCGVLSTKLFASSSTYKCVNKTITRRVEPNLVGENQGKDPE